MPTEQQQQSHAAARFWESDIGRAVKDEYQREQDELRSGVTAQSLLDQGVDQPKDKEVQLTADDSHLPYLADIQSTHDLKEQAYQDGRQGVSRPQGEVDNRYLKPLEKTVMGIDVATGNRLLSRGDFSNDAAASQYRAGVDALRNSSININEGYDANGFKGLVHVASGVIEEGNERPQFERAIDMMGVPQYQANLAWQAAKSGQAHKEVNEAFSAPMSESEMAETANQPLPDISRDQLPETDGWESAAKFVYEADNGEPFTGSSEDLTDWYINEMSNFNWKVLQAPGFDTSSMGAYVVRAMQNGEDYSKALVHLIDTYDRVETDWGIAGQSALALFSDPSTYASLGGGVVAVRAAAAVAKNRMRSALVARIVGASGAGFVEGGVYSGIDEAGRQSVEIEAGVRDNIAWSPEFDEEGNLSGVGVGGAAAIGSVVGTVAAPVIATAAPALFNAGRKAGRVMINNAKKAPSPGPLRSQIGGVGDVGKFKPLAHAASLRNANVLADAGSYQNNRELKVDLQRITNEAAKKAGVNLAEDTPESNDALAEMVYDDAITALASNANAVGWYDQTVGAALDVLSLIHPEIKTSKEARFAYTYALAVTSNGLKVDKNFELAEKAYRFYKENGQMPDSVGIGTASKAINDSLSDFNGLVDEIGIDTLMNVMDGKWTVRQLNGLGFDIGGEWKDTVVRGAAMLGPKIGNGFFSNLNGHFDALTMDRWLMRTWGRLTGTLLVDRPDMVASKSEELSSFVSKLPKAALENWNNLGVDLAADPAVMAKQITKASMLPENREIMNKTEAGDALRRVGNSLTGWIDGQKEAPDVADRNRIRGVFNRVLERLHEQHPDLTMSDLQAVLWYPEKRLYDKAKAVGEVSEGYADDEAPDYANAAMQLARNSGLDEAAIKEAADNGRSRGTRFTKAAEGESQGDAGEGRGFTSSERRQVLREGIFLERRPSGSNSAGNRGFNRRGASRDTSLSGVNAVFTPQAHFATTIGDSEIAPVPEVHQLSTKNTKKNPNVAAASAKKFSDAIISSKQSSPHGAAVYVYSPEEYANMDMYVTPDGLSGFAIKEDGDIVSVFSDGGGKSLSLIQLAIDQGGTKLDAFDTVLPRIYGWMGFEETNRLPWDEQYAPEDWNKEVFAKWNNGEPDVVEMELKR